MMSRLSIGHGDGDALQLIVTEDARAAAFRMLLYAQRRVRRDVAPIHSKA
jgi:hypothetical protein